MVLVNLFVAAKNTIADWYRRRIAYEELVGLSDRSLADIGISRSQIRSLVYAQRQDEAAEAASAATSSGQAHPHGLPLAS